MTEIVLNNITSGYNIAKINANFVKLQDSINNDVLNLSGGNNILNQDVDMNSNDLLNVKTLDVVTLKIGGNPVLTNPVDTLNPNTVDTAQLVNGSVTQGKINPAYEATLAKKADLAAPSGSSLLGFIQENTGAVARTAQDKIREIVSIKDFGAVGDGVSHPLSSVYPTLAAAQVVYPHAVALTDEIDWCAFQSAMNASQNSLRGLRVKVPSGTYFINREITYDASKPLYLDGDSAGSTRIFCTSGVTSFALTIGTSTYQSNQIIVSGLYFPTPSVTTITALHVINCGIDIIGCSFRGMNVGMNLEDAYSFSIEKCIFHDTLSEAIYAGTSADSNNARIVACGMFGCGLVNGSAAIRLVSSDNIHLYDNQIESGYAGVRVDSCTAVNFESNYVENLTGPHFILNGTSYGITIEKNWFGVAVSTTIRNITSGKFAYNTVYNAAFTTSASAIDFEIGQNRVLGTGSLPTSTWQAPTLAGSWVNNGGDYQTAGYRKDSTGSVRLRGQLTGGTTGSVVFTLPVGYRPSARLRFPGSATTSGGCEITINSVGVVTASIAAGGNQIGLNGIIFDAAN